MNPSNASDLFPEDLLDSRGLFSKVFQGLLPFHSLNFYFPDRPQSALTWKERGSLEEVLKSPWVHIPEMHYDPERKRLFYPLSFRHRLLGFLVFFGFPHLPDPFKERLLGRLAALALEMVSLKKQVQLDPATGFLHEAAFRKRLVRLVKDALSGNIQGNQKKLSLAEEHPGRGWVLGFLAFPTPGDFSAPSSDPSGEQPTPIWFKTLRRRFPEEALLAAVRHHPLIVGFVVPEVVGRAGDPFSFLSDGPEGDRLEAFYLGWAAFKPWKQETFQGNPSPFVLMTRWWDQAWTALKAARDLGLNGALGYQEILFRAGRVMDLLPGHRIVINLGEKAGVQYHMRFAISGKEGDGQEKGMAVPLEVQEDLCIAEVIYLEESRGTPRKNDRVRLIPSGTPLPEWTRPGAIPAERALRSFQMFQQKFRQALASLEKFSLILGRVDDYAERLKLWGEKGTAEIRKEMQNLLMKAVPEEGILGPYGRDGFILLVPEKGGKEVKEWAEDLIERFKKELHLSVSLGLADYPCPPFHKGEVMENVIKTLDHLSFLPPASLALFDSVTLNISGDKAYNRGDMEEAVREYERAVLLDPKNINALNSLGVAYAHQGKLEEALTSFKGVLDLSPEDFMASFNLGFALVRLGRLEEAIRIWENLAERNAPDFELYFHLGCLYKDRKEYHKALEWFKRAEGTPNRKGKIYRYLGETEELLGKGKEAMTWYKKALKYQPQHAFCLSRLGALYLDQGESIQVASSLCQQAVRIEPTKGIYWLNLGKVLLANGHPQRALEAFQKALDLGAPLKEVYIFLGQTCRILGRQKDARAFFVLALKQDPETPDLQEYLR